MPVIGSNRVASWSQGTAVPTGGYSGDFYLRTTNGDVYQNIVGTWTVVASFPNSDTGWLTPTLINSWVHFGAPWSIPRYRKINGIVYIKGVISTGAQGTVCLNLPAGFRPGETKILAPYASAVYVKANGDIEVNIKSAAYVSLDDIPPFIAEL